MRGDTRATAHTYITTTRRRLHIYGTQKSTAHDNTPHTIYDEHAATVTYMHHKKTLTIYTQNFGERRPDRITILYQLIF